MGCRKRAVTSIKKQNKSKGSTKCVFEAPQYLSLYEMTLKTMEENQGQEKIKKNTPRSFPFENKDEVL